MTAPAGLLLDFAECKFQDRHGVEWVGDSRHAALKAATSKVG